MIPLRCPAQLKKFPTVSFLIVMGFLISNIVLRIISDDFQNFLAINAFYPNRFSETWYHGLYLSPSYLHLLVNIWFVWIFLPAVRSIYPLWRIIFSVLTGVLLSTWLYSLIHSDLKAPVLGMETWVAVLLGMYMRREIWGEVDTLVFGLGWIKVYSVPCYVLLFFYFFYLLCANLLLKGAFSDAPMLYFLPFFAFIWGFLTGSSLSGDKHLT